jgi:hypothetical protein
VPLCDAAGVTEAELGTATEVKVDSVEQALRIYIRIHHRVENDEWQSTGEELGYFCPTTVLRVAALYAWFCCVPTGTGRSEQLAPQS